MNEDSNNVETPIQQECLKEVKQKIEFSKKLILDIRVLLWIVTLSGIVLAIICVFKDFTSSLPWISSMVSLPWTAHGVVCSFYLNMAKSDHSEGGITFETAKANNFQPVENRDSPPI